MCMTERRQAGFTLIELMFFIVVVLIGIAGILMVMDVSVRSSADPMVRKQATALADSVMEEILLKSFDDPDGLPNVIEAGGRAAFDDVDDFNGVDETLATPSAGVFQGLPPLLDGYRIQIQVTSTALATVAVKRVVVTVSRGNEAVTLTGYRASY